MSSRSKLIALKGKLIAETLEPKPIEGGFDKYLPAEKINIISQWIRSTNAEKFAEAPTESGNDSLLHYNEKRVLSANEPDTSTLNNDIKPDILPTNAGSLTKNELNLVIVPSKESVAHLPEENISMIMLNGDPYDIQYVDLDFENEIKIRKERKLDINYFPSTSKIEIGHSNGEETERKVFNDDEVILSSSSMSSEVLSKTQNDYDVAITSEILYDPSSPQASEGDLRDLEFAEETLTQKPSSAIDITKNQGEVEVTSRRTYSDKRDFCFFCEKDISHFSRHIYTWHKQEFEVQQVLALNPKSKKRRDALSALRKKGNFIKNRTGEKLRPVRRALQNTTPSQSDYLPCHLCLGFYKKSCLFRHTKVCLRKQNMLKDGQRQHSQSLGQTTLLLGSLLKHDMFLKKELFPHMRADEVGLVVRNDALICNYGYSYLKGRRSKGNLDFVRQDMRRLAKLLIFCRKECKEIQNFLQILRPCHFQLIVKGINHIARYNTETDTYESPTLAMNFGTALKKCCDLAYIHLLQENNTNDQRKEIKILKTLITSQWANEVSAQASNNLNSNKWNKEDLLPITSDLAKLNAYLKTISEEAYNLLQEHPKNLKAYTLLKEALFVQIILLNRRRPAEVAQLKVQTYKGIDLHSQTLNKNEFEQSLTETEKILLKSYNRIVIRGKRGRGVPVLLSELMKKKFDYLVEIRENFVKQNEFIFHTSGDSCIDGSKVIAKYAKKCDLQKPEMITATSLRKHLATVTQLLQFSEKDLEQLAKFMGHTLNIHCNFYRLSDNVYQTAKVSKLLLLASEGGLEKFKGRSLDEIDVDLNVLQDNNEHNEEIIEEIIDRRNFGADATEDATKCIKQVEHSVISKAKIPSKKQTWSMEEKILIKNHFSEHIKKKVPPKQYEVESFMGENAGRFDDRKWTSIKALVYNIYTNKLKVL